MALAYERRDDDSILSRIALDEGTVFVIHAADIRRERTGVHACVTLVLNQTILAYDTFNIGRSEERNRLANAAHKMLGGPLAEQYSPNLVRHDLDIFCATLWREYSGRTRVEVAFGDATPTQPDFALTPYVVRGAGTVLFGPPAEAKSWTMMLMAASLEHGAPHLWPTEGKGRPLFVNLERSAASVTRRLARVNQALGLDPSAGLLCMNARGKSLADVVDEIRRAIREMGVDVVFLDSISRAGMGDLNENGVGNRIIDVLNSLGVAWLAIAHSPRSDTSHLYGSVMQEAGADIIIRQITERRGNDLYVAIEVTKGNDLPAVPRQLMLYRFDPDYGLASVDAARASDFHNLDADKKPTLYKQVVAYLRDAQPATATDIADGIHGNRTNISHLLNGDNSFVRLPRTGHEQPWGLAVKDTVAQGNS